MKKSTYALLSIGVAMLLIVTAPPYYLTSSVCFPGWNVYWDYATAQKNMTIAFAVVSTLGVLTTLQKRVSLEDVLLNVMAPFVVLMVIKIFQFQILFVLTAVGFAVTMSVVKVIRFVHSKKYPKGSWKGVRLAYYVIRKRLICSLFFLLLPMSVFVNFYEDSERERIIHSASIEEGTVNDYEEELTLPSETEWEAMTVDERFDTLAYFTRYENGQLGLESKTEVYSIKELTDGRLAYYSSDDDAFYYNVFFLNDTSLEEALHVACHESHYRYAQVIIDSMLLLDESEIEYGTIACFEEAIKYKDAARDYYFDSLEYDSYKSNYIEEQAELYAKEEMKRLNQEFGWSEQED